MDKMVNSYFNMMNVIRTVRSIGSAADEQRMCTCGCVGPRGLTGNTGDTGPVGATGLPGSSGELGFTGSTGRPGSTGQ